MDLVTVCIPTFNGVKFLNECIASARAQTYSNLEILIVDDRSTDESAAIAARYADEDTRVRVVRNAENLGLVGNWNRSIALATGEWIKFLFQDDLLDPRCVQCLIERAAEDGSRFVACQRDFLFDRAIDDLMQRAYLRNREVIDEFLAPNRGVSAQQYAQRILRRINYNYIGEPTATLIHKSVFDDYGLFNDDLAQVCDLEYWARVASHIGVAYVPQTLATFRAHGGATSAVNRGSKLFRASGLDTLLLLRFMIERPEYASMRDIWRRDGLYESAEKQLWNRTNEVREFVAGNGSMPFEKWTVAEEYTDFLARFPECGVSTLPHWRWKLRMATSRAKHALRMFVAARTGRSIEQF